MAKFKKGDRVVANREARLGDKGKYAVVEGVVREGHDDLIYVCFEDQPRIKRCFYAYRFDIAEPDTPFHAAVRAYIQRELPNG